MTKLKLFFSLFFIVIGISGCTITTDQIDIIQNEMLSTVINYGDELPDFSTYVTLKLNNEIQTRYALVIDESQAFTNQIGSFEVFYSYKVETKNYNHSIVFSVVDQTPPQIHSSVSSITINFGETLPQLLPYLSITDNYDQNLQPLESMIDISDVDLGRVGTYQISISTTDTSNNRTTITLPVTIVDLAAPVITSLYETISIEQGSTSVDLVSFISAFDNVDGIISVTTDMIDFGSFNINLSGTYELTYYIYDSSQNYTSFILEVIVTQSTELNYFRLDQYQTITSISDFDGSLPKSGNPQLLVLPVDFSSRPGTASEKQKIELAFFGESSQTGWESVKSFYEKSSYGALSLSGTVMNWYRAKNTPTYYESRRNGDGDQLLIKEALTYHAQHHDLSIYDSDDDGYIDAIYIIYSIDYDDSSDLWWAYQYWYEGEEKYDGVEAYYYVFASLDFINEGNFGINAKTYIHETGHLLGLDDYYDYNYNSGPKGGLGGADMMDSTIGDHASISKLLLGWINPYITTGDTTITIDSFSSSGDAIIVIPSWNDTIFDEYFIIDFYTPTDLNEQDKMFEVSGVRIYHINAKVGSGGYGGEYISFFQYDNSDTVYKFVRLIEADGRNDIEKSNSSYATDSDLFQADNLVSLSLYGKQSFVTISILSINSQATIFIDYTN
jgi:M6 family metalloprotease-like protein